MKKILFLLFTCLMLVAMVIPACKPTTEAGDVIKIGVIGPMQYLQGQNHWWGATQARDEINAAGGIQIGDKSYQIELIQSDSNEINSVTDATSAMEKLITVDGANFVIGGFRTEAVIPMQEVAMDNKMIFMICGAADQILVAPVKSDYERYKYTFRVTPFVSAKLADNVVMTLAMAQARIKEETGIQRKLKVAVCTEGAKWADSITGIMNAYVPKKLGMEVVGTWRPSPTATELTAEMTDMQSKNTDIICEIFSGPVGIPYARSYGELKIPAASVGINVESQSDPGFWKNTNGLGEYDTSLNSYARGLEVDPLTLPFIDKFIELNGQVPAYNAGTYDAIYIIKSALERAGTAAIKSDGTWDSDMMVAELEKTNQVSTLATPFQFTTMDAPGGNPHDVPYGPGITTGISTQWVAGEQLAVWPNADYADASVAAGYPATWKDVKYGGIHKWVVPPLLLDKLKAEGGTAPVAPETPAATPEATPAAGEETAAAATSFAAKTYTNTEYGFTFQYPSDWVERPDMVTTVHHLAAFSVSAFVPGIVAMQFDADAPESVDWIKASVGQIGGQSPKVLTDITDATTPDGSKAYTYKLGYISSTGYEAEGWCKDVDRDGKRLRFMVYTVTAFADYDQALFEEIVNTVTFK